MSGDSEKRILRGAINQPSMGCRVEPTHKCSLCPTHKCSLCGSEENDMSMEKRAVVNTEAEKTAKDNVTKQLEKADKKAARDAAPVPPKEKK